MELHSVHGEFAMASAMISPSSLSAVISRHAGNEVRFTTNEWYRPASNGFDKSEKSAVPVMRDDRCLPVHQARSAHDFSAICFGDALMSQANTQNRNPWPNARMTSLLMPASRGVHGPGKCRYAPELSARFHSIEIASFRLTTSSHPSSPKYCARL